MQDGVGGMLHQLGSQFSGGWTKQGEQFHRQASDILVSLSHWLTFHLPGRPGLGNGLIGSGFVLTPHLQSQLFCRQVRPLNHRFFSGVKGS
jgi:hypothetical protein